MSDVAEVTRKLIDGCEQHHLMPLPTVCEILAGETGVSSAGFPYISQTAFASFLTSVPHLFRDGENLLRWLGNLEKIIYKMGLTSDETRHVTASIGVIRNVIRTAGVTAPPDLWVLWHVLHTHSRLGINARFDAGEEIDVIMLAADRGLNAAHLMTDFSLLRSRGYLIRRGPLFTLNKASSQAEEVYSRFHGLPSDIPVNMVPVLRRVLSGQATVTEREYADRFLAIHDRGEPHMGWHAGLLALETGMRLVSLVLALHGEGLLSGARAGAPLAAKGQLTPAMVDILRNTGMTTRDGSVSQLGERTLARAPGPYGIIHAYYPYMEKLPDILQGRTAVTHVSRGENVAASQDANRKTFRMANDALDRFCERYGFGYSVFIEHAVGRGEATRQRYLKDKEHRLAYVGADLEDAAIDAAAAQQASGNLPRNMQFVRNADIGRPDVLTAALARLGLASQGAVMMVGNGFHEVRGMSNEQMIDVFRAYCAAGIVLIFTEESALSDDDLLQTGWNTYHAGFRYVHDLSGQALRPAADRADHPLVRFSWEKCAALGGYAVVPEFTTRTRTIYPHPRADGYNPAISVTYFCVPGPMMIELSKKG